MTKALGVKKWDRVIDIDEGPYPGSNKRCLWYEYAATNFPKVYAHHFGWAMEGWGDSGMILSINIEKTKFIRKKLISKKGS